MGRRFLKQARRLENDYNRLESISKNIEDIRFAVLRKYNRIYGEKKIFFERVDYTKIPELSKKMKSFFCQGRTINTTSYMNLRIPKDVGTSFWILAEGYFETADILIKKCL